MKRSSPALLIALAVLGGAGGWFLDTWRVSVGSPAFVVPPTVGIALGLIGLVLVGYAVPVYRAARRRSSRTVDPFYATRVVVLAKASSLGGVLLGGIGAGLLAFPLTRAVVASGDAITGAAVVLAGGIVLLAGGLVAEHLCRIPPDDRDDDGRPEAVTPKP